jgi:DNA-binding response OmpR family regulator
MCYTPSGDKEGSEMSTSPHGIHDQPSTRRVRLKKVLLVDADPAQGPELRRELEANGYYLNHVTSPEEARRREAERCYDLVVCSAALGEGVLGVLIDELGRKPSPPPVLVLSGPEGLKRRADLDGVTCLMVLRSPFTPADVADAARALAGPPWEEPGNTA